MDNCVNNQYNTCTDLNTDLTFSNFISNIKQSNTPILNKFLDACLQYDWNRLTEYYTGNTPLMCWLMYRNDQNIPYQLLYNGCQRQKNLQGYTPLMIWFKYHKVDKMVLIKQIPSDENCQCFKQIDTDNTISNSNNVIDICQNLLNDTITNNTFPSFLAYDNWTNDIMSLISQTLEIYDKHYYNEQEMYEQELCNGFREKGEIIYPNIRHNRNTNNRNTNNTNTDYNSNSYQEEHEEYEEQQSSTNDTTLFSSLNTNDTDNYSDEDISLAIDKDESSYRW